MRELQLSDWQSAREAFGEAGAAPPERKRQLLFRGQADSAWPLTTTLDREVGAVTPERRTQLRWELLRDFRRLSLGLFPAMPTEPLGWGWEFLARHHGLPSPIIDWSRSAYIAAFFAFSDPVALGGASSDVAIWMLDRSQLNHAMDAITRFRFSDEDEDEEELSLQSNPRAIEQQGVSLVVESISETIETALSEALTRYTIPCTAAHRALQELDSLSINDRNLFLDLDAAARTARLRARLLRSFT